MHNRTHIIINPASAGGRTQRRMHTIVRALSSVLGELPTVHVTQRPLDAMHIAEEVSQNGARFVIIVGGDGTIHEVVNGLFSAGYPSMCEIAIVSSGSGRGFGQSLNLPAHFEDQVRCVSNGSRRRVDCGTVSFKTFEGPMRSRYFINECQVGIGAEVVKGVQNGHKILGGRIAFGLGTLQTLFSHRNVMTQVLLDDQTHANEVLTGITIGNGAFMGGGMNLVPGAQVDDGVLDVLLMHGMSILQRLFSFPLIYKGKHAESKFFTLHRTRKITIESDKPALVAADGELLGTTPCHIEILPSSLLVHCKNGGS